MLAAVLVVSTIALAPPGGLTFWSNGFAAIAALAAYLDNDALANGYPDVAEVIGPWNVSARTARLRFEH